MAGRGERRGRREVEADPGYEWDADPADETPADRAAARAARRARSGDEPDAGGRRDEEPADGFADDVGGRRRSDDEIGDDLGGRRRAAGEAGDDVGGRRRAGGAAEDDLGGGGRRGEERRSRRRSGGDASSRRSRRGSKPAPSNGGGAARGSSDLVARVLAAIPAIGFALFVILAGDWIFAAAAIALGLVCVHELFRMYAAVRPAQLAGFLAVIGLGLAAQMGEQRHVLLVMVACVPAVFLVAMAMPDVERRTAGMSISVLGVVWIGGGIAHAIMLAGLDHGAKVILIILIGTFLGDTAAYLGGRAFGRRKLAPAISPNKTLEGLVLGLFGAVLATLLGKLYADWMTFGEGALLGLAVAIAAPLGDLFESQVKRDAGTKDAGSLFGAHGGALDRLDAALFTLTAGYYIWQAMLS